MLNPITDKYYVEFSSEFWNTDFAKPYTDFLFHKNHPIKNIEGHILESIQNVSIPGMTLNTLVVEGLNNTGTNRPGNGLLNGAPPTINAVYPGTSNINQIVEGTTLTITFKNTILNWMYIYTYFRHAYKRQNNESLFQIRIVVKDASETNMFMFMFSQSFISNMPGLDFSFNDSIMESKTFDIGFTFSKYDVEFLYPNFNKLDV